MTYETVARFAQQFGLVYFGLAAKGAETRVERHQFPGDRATVRRASVETALDLLGEAL